MSSHLILESWSVAAIKTNERWNHQSGRQAHNVQLLLDENEGFYELLYDYEESFTEGT